MEPLQADIVSVDPDLDTRPPSEISPQLDDSPDVDPFHHTPPRKPPLVGQENESMYDKLLNLQIFHKTDFVLLMYGFMNDSKIDLTTITDVDLDPSAETVSWYDFKSMAIYAGVRKHLHTRQEVNEAAERLTGLYTDDRLPTMGPFTVKNPDGTFTVLNPEYLEQGMLSHYGHLNMCMLVRVVPWQAMFLNVMPNDMLEINQPDNGRIRKRLQLMEGRDCMIASKRMLKDILLGVVNDLATSPFFYSNKMKKEFFKFMEDEGKLDEIFVAVDKFSKPSRPKTFLYCIVANKNPNLDFLDQVLTRFLKSKNSDEEKKLQIVATCEAACQWGHVLVYEKLSRQIEKPTFEMLRRSVIGGNSDIIRSILRDYIWSESQKTSAIEWACFLGFDEVVRVLQDDGVNFSARCLYESACGGSMNLFFELCNEGGNLEKAFKDGQTVLHATSERGHFSIVEFLVHRGGVSVDPETTNGETALQLALKNSHTEVAETLLDGGADCRHLDKDGSTPLHKACTVGSIQLVDKMIATIGSELNILDNNGRSLLHKAAFGGNIDVINRLLECGHHVGVLDHMGSSVVHYAAIQGHLGVVEFFVNKCPALIAQGNTSRWNPIACAAFAGHFGVLHFLTRNRAGILVITSEGLNAKQLAEQGKALMEAHVEHFMDQFGEYVTFGSVASFDAVLDLLSDVTRQLESTDSD